MLHSDRLALAGKQCYDGPAKSPERHHCMFRLQKKAGVREAKVGCLKAPICLVSLTVGKTMCLDHGGTTPVILRVHSYSLGWSAAGQVVVQPSRQAGRNLQPP